MVTVLIQLVPLYCVTPIYVNPVLKIIRTPPESVTPKTTPPGKPPAPHVPVTVIEYVPDVLTVIVPAEFV